MNPERSASDRPRSAYASSGAPASGYRLDSPRSSYTYEQKCFALAVIADTDSASTASNVTGIPRSTIVGWADSDEGVALIDSLRQSIRANCGHIYSVITFKALNKALIALEQGEEHMTKDGTIVMLAPRLKDCMMAAAIATDKHALIVGMLEGSKHVDKALGTLAEKLLAKMAEAKPKTADTKPPPSAGGDYLG